MTPENPIVTHYLANLDGNLKGLNDTDRTGAVRDIRSHISEAMAQGEPLDRVLKSLGPPDALARAYSVELLLKKPSGPQSRGNRALRLAGLIILGSVPTFVIVVVLGVVGVVFSITGVALFAAGQAALSDSLPWWITMDADPRLATIIGPFMSVVGLMCLFGLGLYLKLAAKVVTRVLPPKTQAAS
jgi:uncharacterized membrane protein